MLEICAALLFVVVAIQIISLIQINKRMKKVEDEIYDLGSLQNEAFKYLQGIEQKMFEIKVEMIARGASGIKMDVPVTQPTRRRPGRPFKTATKEKTP